MKVWRELQLAALQISSTETPFSKAQEDETPRVECACGTVAQLLALLALQPHSKKVMGLIPALGAVGSGGQVLPRPSVLRWVISWAFLCGVCMFSPCSQGVSSTKNPNSKNMQNNRTHVHP